MKNVTLGEALGSNKVFSKLALRVYELEERVKKLEEADEIIT